MLVLFLNFFDLRSEPIDVNGTSIYFRGNAILKAIMQYLRDNGLKEASDVILTGCSGTQCIL